MQSFVVLSVKLMRGGLPKGKQAIRMPINNSTNLYNGRPAGTAMHHKISIRQLSHP